jgi:sialidase-1
MSRNIVRCLVASIVLLTAMAGVAFCQGTVLVAFGDSTTARRDSDHVVVYATLLEKAFAAKGLAAKVVNAGVGGNTTADARARFEKDVLAHHPGLAVIQFGLNDAAADVWRNPPQTAPRISEKQYADNLRYFVATLKKRGAEVILMTPNPCLWSATMRRLYGKPPYQPENADGCNVLVRRYAELVRQVAREEAVTLIDIYDVFHGKGQAPAESMRKLMLEDGIHPNSKGHALIADLLLAAKPLAEKLGARQKTAAGKGPLFEQTVAVKVERQAHGPRGMPGDLVFLKDGTLLMSYTIDDVGIMGIKSADQGRTWGKPFVLVANPKPPAGGHVACPGFLRLANGDILMSYCYTTYPTTPYYAHVYYRRSADEGKTWSEQFCMTPYPGYVLVHNDRLHILSSGRILAPAEYKAHMPSTADHSGYVGMSFYSDDGGYSWQASKNVVDMQPIEVQEADAVELKDGRVMMFARTYSGHPVRAYSRDGGATWSKGEEIKELAMPYAGLPTVRRIPATGDLLFIWISEQSVDKKDARIARRCALSAAISRDEGKTFLFQRNIARDTDDDYGYQSVRFVGNDLVLIAYHAREGLRVARIGLDWFYGK